MVIYIYVSICMYEEFPSFCDLWMTQINLETYFICCRGYVVLVFPAIYLSSLRSNCRTTVDNGPQVENTDTQLKT